MQGQQLARLSNEAGVIMEHAVGEGDSLLRAFAEVEAQTNFHLYSYYLCNHQ